MQIIKNKLSIQVVYEQIFNLYTLIKLLKMNQIQEGDLLC
jgi:hypothetical protein